MSDAPVALITGITGQDGAYMAAHLLSQGYQVVGCYRRSSTPNFWRLRVLEIFGQVNLVPFDLSDQSSISQIFKHFRPIECYNFASQSFVPVSFACPESTSDANHLGVVRILEAIRTEHPKCRLYQASSSEMFGDAPSPQSIESPFRPRSPYAVAKVSAHLAVRNYREAYGLHVSSGIAFNHESPLRGVEFVTKKISQYLCNIKVAGQGTLLLGNMDAIRDWGFAGDYVEAMYAMVQRDEPGDVVICTGVGHSVSDFVDLVAAELGMELEWCGAGADLVALDQEANEVIKIDPSLYRPVDVPELIGDPQQALDELGWNAETTLSDLAALMVRYDLEEAKAMRRAR